MSVRRNRLLLRAIREPGRRQKRLWRQRVLERIRLERLRRTLNSREPAGPVEFAVLAAERAFPQIRFDVRRDHLLEAEVVSMRYYRRRPQPSETVTQPDGMVVTTTKFVPDKVFCFEMAVTRFGVIANSANQLLEMISYEARRLLRHAASAP